MIESSPLTPSGIVFQSLLLLGILGIWLYIMFNGWRLWLGQREADYVEPFEAPSVPNAEPVAVPVPEPPSTGSAGGSSTPHNIAWPLKPLDKNKVILLLVTGGYSANEIANALGGNRAELLRMIAAAKSPEKNVPAESDDEDEDEDDFILMRGGAEGSAPRLVKRSDA